MQQNEQKVSMTYEQVDKALESPEGLIGYRLRKNDMNVYSERLFNNEWVVFDSRPRYRKQFVVRDLYKVLKFSGYFDPECEFMTKLKFESSAARSYQKEYNEKQKEKQRNKRIEDAKITGTREYTIKEIQMAAKKYEELPVAECGNQPSICMQFDNSIVRVLDFWFDELSDNNNIVTLSVVDSVVHLEQIQHHHSYRGINLDRENDKVRIDELMRKIEAL